MMMMMMMMMMVKILYQRPNFVPIWIGIPLSFSACRIGLQN
jgi:hypothetical protein